MCIDTYGGALGSGSSVQGKPFIKLAGLLQMAHATGLMILSKAWTSNNAEVSLAHAVTRFADGRHFEETGAATPTHVTKKVALHFR